MESLASVQGRLKLRHYQQDAVRSGMYPVSNTPENGDVVVVPTGGGKTVIIAELALIVSGKHGRMLVLTHVKELVEQAENKILSHFDADVGVYSAAIGRRELDRPITCASIQSIYRRAVELTSHGTIDLVVIDEAHRIPLEGEGMYQTFLAELRRLNPSMRVLGLTATPFRTDGGPICRPDHFLNQVVYEASIRELTEAGFLCPLSSKRKGQFDTESIHIVRGEFDSSESEAEFSDEEKLDIATSEIIDLTANRNKVLAFCCSVSHSKEVVKRFKLQGHECGLVTGETATLDREAIIERFNKGDLKYLANVNVLTEGFDSPAIDCVVLLRATMSPGLYYQMVGRGLRLHESKKNCLVLDYGGNAKRFGPIDSLLVQKVDGRKKGEAPTRVCPDCDEVLHAGVRACLCGHEFEREEARLKHSATASTDPITTKLVRQVTAAEYAVHVGPSGFPCLRIDYFEDGERFASDFLTIENPRDEFREKKWRSRSRHHFPFTAQRALEIALSGGVKIPTEIKLEYFEGSRFPRIARRKYS